MKELGDVIHDYGMAVNVIESVQEYRQAEEPRLHVIR
jgi:hypothetical protein